MGSPPASPARPNPMDTTPNRLSISHLMLWMATTGMVLAEVQWDLSTAGLPPDRVDAMRLEVLVGSLGFGPLNGLAIAGLLILLWRRFWTRVPFPTEPGHWILVIAGANQTIHLIYHVLYLLWIRGEAAAVPGWASSFSRFAIEGFVILLAVIGASSRHQGRIWNVSIGSLALHPGMTICSSVTRIWIPATRQFLGGSVWMNISRLGYTLPGLLAIAGAVVDWRRKQRRDFLHWCGVALVVLGPVVEWLRTLLLR